jgi:hypothetical protein
MTDDAAKTKKKTTTRKLSADKLYSRRRRGLTLEELKNKYLNAEKATA